MESVLPQPSLSGYFLINGISGYMQRYGAMEARIKVRNRFGVREEVKASLNYR